MLKLCITGDLGFEFWAPIPSADGFEASTYGRVRSTNKIVQFGKQKRKCGGVILKQHIKGKCRYLQVNLSKHSKQNWRTVHSLIAETFLCIPPKYRDLIGTRKLHINHKDEFDIYNNRVENLEYLSCLDNQLYGTKIQRQRATLIRHNQEKKRI